MSLLDFGASLWTWWMGWALRGAVLLAVVLVLDRLRRGSTAGERHLLLATSLGLVVVLPMVGGIAPLLPVPLLAAGPGAASPGVAESASLASARPAPAFAAPASTMPGRDFLVETPPSTTARIPIFALLGGALWLVGFLVFASRRLHAHARLLSFQAEASALDGALWRSVVDTLREELGIRRPVRLLVHPDAATPATWGVFHPVVLLPVEARGWSADRRRAVLLHEFGHVRRFDVLVHHFATFIRALHWFDPLVWIAVQQMRIEREKACDDLVLAAGGRPSGYAATLLDLVRRLRTARLPLPAAAALGIPGTARGASELEHRLTHVLNPSRRTQVMTPLRFTSTLLVSLALALPVAGLQVTARSRTVDPAPTPLPDARPTQDAKEKAGAKDAGKVETKSDAKVEKKADAKADATPGTKPKVTRRGSPAGEGGIDGKPAGVPAPTKSGTDSGVTSRVWTNRMPTAKELEELFPGVENAELRKLLAGVKRGTKGGLSGLPTDEDQKEHPRAKRTAGESEKLVKKALDDFEKELGPQARVQVQGLRSKISEVPASHGKWTKTAHDVKSDRAGGVKSSSDRDSASDHATDSQSAHDADSSSSSSSHSSSSSSSSRRGGTVKPGAAPGVSRKGRGKTPPGATPPGGVKPKKVTGSAPPSRTSKKAPARH